MKKFNTVLLVFVAFVTVFSSCTKDISGPVDVNFLEGKWNFDKSTVSSSVITLAYTTDYLKNEVGCNKDFLEFLPGGVGKYGNYTSGCAFEQKVGNWSTSGTNIIIAIAGSSVNDTFVIASLSATELILQIEGTYEGKSGTLNLYFKK